MPHYVVSSETPITAKELHKPDMPDWEAGQLPTFPSWPERPGRPIYPTLPPREEWPPLPPWLQPGVGLPIPPTVDLPWVPIPPGEEIDPPEIWPPLPEMPGLPDLSGKTLILATFHVSRYVSYTRWVIIDHEEAKGKIQKAIDWIKAHLPAGGIGGRPPDRPGPNPPVPGQHR